MKYVGKKWLLSPIKTSVQTPWNYHSHEAQPSRATKRRRDEEQILTKQTSQMKPPTHKQKKTATEEPPWDGQ